MSILFFYICFDMLQNELLTPSLYQALSVAHSIFSLPGLAPGVPLAGIPSPPLSAFVFGVELMSHFPSTCELTSQAGQAGRCLPSPPQWPVQEQAKSFNPEAPWELLGKMSSSHFSFLLKWLTWSCPWPLHGESPPKMVLTEEGETERRKEKSRDLMACCEPLGPAS